MGEAAKVVFQELAASQNLDSDTSCGLDEEGQGGDHTAAGGVEEEKKSEERL